MRLGRLMAAVVAAAGLLWPSISTSAGLTRAQVGRLVGLHLDELVASGSLSMNNQALGHITIRSSLDIPLQRWVVGQLLRSRALAAGVVALDATSGRVLALAGVEGGRPWAWNALIPAIPAASLFKIVTAAALIEQAGLGPFSPLTYVGRAHTLYRFQLRWPQPWRRPIRTTLARAFARSNNALFGRLGLRLLGPKVLTRYARAFGFEGDLGLEIALPPSRLMHPASDFGVAEMACGFNRVTTTSPLHAALMAAVAPTGGRMPIPWIVNEVVGSTGEVLYRQGAPRARVVVRPATARALEELMQATVRIGTARRAFRRVVRSRAWAGIVFGAKTGTIASRDKRERYEWLAAYAKGPGKIVALGVVVVHNGYRRQSARVLGCRVLTRIMRPGPLRRAVHRQRRSPGPGIGG